MIKIIRNGKLYQIINNTKSIFNIPFQDNVRKKEKLIKYHCFVIKCLLMIRDKTFFEDTLFREKFGFKGMSKVGSEETDAWPRFIEPTQLTARVTALVKASYK